MRFLALSEVLRLHSDLVAETGGATGVRDLGRIQAALAQPMATFDGDELYPTIVDKAAALGFALVQGHAFIDGNKRIGHAAMEVFLMLNGFDLNESVDEQERAILSVASGTMTRVLPRGHANRAGRVHMLFVRQPRSRHAAPVLRWQRRRTNSVEEVGQGRLPSSCPGGGWRAGRGSTTGHAFSPLPVLMFSATCSRPGLSRCRWTDRVLLRWIDAIHAPQTRRAVKTR